MNSKSHSPAPEVADPQSDLLRVESTRRSMGCTLVRQFKELGVAIPRRMQVQGMGIALNPDGEILVWGAVLE